MVETTESRVAVYIDFDNIVISRYSQLHPKFARDNLSRVTEAKLASGPELAKRLKNSTLDIGAILDFASSFGSVVISRAYADWSAVVNASYRQQLINRAVDLVQLFPTSGQKNGADIRLAIDAVEDLFRLPDITHVVIVAGDSDYIALAQRSKRLGRRVIGIGVAGSTSESLAAACDEFASYDTLLDLDSDDDLGDSSETSDDSDANTVPSAAPTTRSPSTKAQAQAAEPVSVDELAPSEKAEKPAKKVSNPPDPKRAAGRLLRKAIALVATKEDAEWVVSSAVKNQMLRIDPTFREKALGHKTFTEFVKEYNSIVECDDNSAVRKLRLRS